MKRIILQLITIIALFCAACADKFDNNRNTEESRYFISRNTIPYYFYDSTGSPIIKYFDRTTYPLSYVDSMPDIITIEEANQSAMLFSNYDGIGMDTSGKAFWFCFNKGCYDSTKFQYFVRTQYLHDTINVEYIYDTIDIYRVMIYVHKLTYNGVLICGYEEDSTKRITSDHVDVFKYNDSTVVKPVYKQK
ncbi:MAG: hypothetical protein J6Z01_13865 [Bacteroidales bacterium]|nr:hypothetical protein [Bacteroidales bacterium]